jgi:hypothetical protein
MHPYISQAIINDRTAELRQQAAVSRLARQVRQARHAGRHATTRHAAEARPVPSGAGRPRAAC